MKAEVDALRTVIESVDLSNRIESLKLYATALAIAGVLEIEIEQSGHFKAAYILEKLALFTSYFHYAVIPTGGTAHDPPYASERPHLDSGASL